MSSRTSKAEWLMENHYEGLKIYVNHVFSTNPGCQNRDRSGNQKTIWYGGFTRAFISSQCENSNMCRSPEYYDLVNGVVAYRVKDCDALLEALYRHFPEESERIGEKILGIASGRIVKPVKNKKNDRENKQGCQFIDLREAIVLADTICEMDVDKIKDDKEKKAAMKKAEKKAKELCEDIPMPLNLRFHGRFTASSPYLDKVRSTISTTPSISCNTWNESSDLFTVMDDLTGESGHIDDFYISSNTLHRCLVFDVESILEKTDLTREKAVEVIAGYLKIEARKKYQAHSSRYRSSKKTGVMLVRMGTKLGEFSQPFERPVRDRDVDESLLDTCVQRLDSEFHNMINEYGPDDNGSSFAFVMTDSEWESTKSSHCFADLTEWMVTNV